MQMIKAEVITRDGITLATDVYLPSDGEGSFPVIFERTPYGKTRPSSCEIHSGDQWSREEVAHFFTQRGYVVVYQDCRGRYDSTGVFVKYLSEPNDGYDSLQWLARQTWCNGNIGTMGLSYSAHTQMATACLTPPLDELKCMVLDSGGFSNSYTGGVRQGGAFELKQVTWAIQQSRPELSEQEVQAWFDKLPWKRGNSPLTPKPEYEEYLFDLWERELFDDYWKQLGIYAIGYYENIKKPLPTVIMSSWYDAYVRTTLDNYAEFIQRGQDVQFIMGPWLHACRHLPYAGDVHFGDNSLIEAFSDNWLKVRLNWFDKHLKKFNSPQDDQFPVKLFLMGGGSGRRRPSDNRLDHGGTWIKAKDFPIANTKFVNYYLQKNSVLSPTTNTAPEIITYSYNPLNPTPTIGGSITTGELVFKNGAFDQRENEEFYGCPDGSTLPLSERQDVLVFQTSPLESQVNIIGEIKVSLTVSSDCPDTDFTAKLIDVYPPSEDYPNGYAMNLLDGIFRAKFHNSFESIDLLQPDKQYEIQIDLTATANSFSPGHRIRLDISSSNFPRFDVNPNTGKVPIKSVGRKIAHNSIHVGGTTSYMTLPIAPTDSLSQL